MRVTPETNEALSPEEKRRERLQAIARELDCYTVQDMEALYDMSAATLAAMRAKGQGPDFTTLGRTTLYPKESVHQFIRHSIGQRSSKARTQRRKSEHLDTQQQALSDGLTGDCGRALV